MTNRRGILRVLAVLAATSLVFAACGEDDDDAAAPGAGDGDNTLQIEMKDFAYAIEGEVTEGFVTIESENTGKEFHMAGFGKLKPGVDIADVQEGFQKAFAEGPPGEGPPGEGPPGDAPAGEAGQEDGGGDPFEEFFDEEQGELGAPGHILMPGKSQTISSDVFTAGNYAVICFIPAEGEGTPHFAKGMLASFEVKAATTKAAAPEPDETITLTDNQKPTTPTKLDSGTHTFALAGQGPLGNDFVIARAKSANDDPSKVFEEMDKFFTDNFEGPDHPAKGLADKAPGEIVASTFEVTDGQTVYLTVDLEPGKYIFVNTTNQEGEEGETDDQFVIVEVT